ncbi:MAG: RNA polymerase sigma factor [Phycisphaerales bacterium]|nr:RNA polymerase sigma factor [Phycisphaerales bacterium]
MDVFRSNKRWKLPEIPDTLNRCRRMAVSCGGATQAVAQDLDQIIGKAAQGDQDAFETLYRRYGHFVQKHIQKRLPAYRGDIAEEVAQEVWHAVYQQLPRYDSRLASFTRWLAVICTRRAITHSKRLKLRQDRLQQLESLASPSSDSPQADPTAKSEVSELMAAVRECADLLQGREREIFRLVRFNEMSAADIAVLHGITPGRVRGALCDANQKVLACLQQKDLF